MPSDAPPTHGVLGLYWPAREEAFEVCADKATRTLQLLSGVGFATFRRLANSRKKAEQLVFEPTPDAVHALLRRGVNRTDVGREVIAELGWRLGLWSGGSDDECFSVDIHCGCYSQWVGNNVLVRFPYAGARTLPEQIDAARALYRALVALWQPEQATLCDGDIEWTDGVLTPAGTCLELLQKRV